MKYPPLVLNKYCKTPITVILEREGLNVYGEPLEEIRLDLFCNYQDKVKTIYEDDKKIIKINGLALFNGDICERLPTISGGYVFIFGGKRTIHSAKKARNPDGSVNYTSLELM